MILVQKSSINDCQRGAVLIVALILLLILTIMAVSSMQVVSLQESMAGGSRDNNLAFQASEAALREGERIVVKKFEGGDISDLWADPVTDSYASFSGVTKAPKYKVDLLVLIKYATEAGMPIDTDGALARIESVGFGNRTTADNVPVAQVNLISTFLVK